MVAIGAVDDKRGLSTTSRFIAQAGAILIMIYGAETRLSDLGTIIPGGYVLPLGWFSVPFTIFACIGVINAINMTDGLDGLSGNLILVMLLGFGIANNLWGSPEHLALLNILSGAVAGFLIFNQRILGRNKAWVFMGDAGSMMLGYTLAWAAVEVSQGGAKPAFMSPAAVLWLLTVPLYDTVAIMLRRILAGQSPMHPDNRHLHHLLIRVGYTVGEAITIICLFSLCGIAFGLIAARSGLSDFALAMLFLSGGVVYMLLIERAWRRRSLFGRPFADSG
jgi:UDP-GlcNAc:undecaprenyl-phosphate GlcNAc-1-phosphate transferase